MSADGVDIAGLLAGLDLAQERVLEAATRAVGIEAKVVLGESKELCPVSPSDPQHPLYIGTSGSLRDSGTHVGPEREGTQVSSIIGYNTDYAAAVHERTAVNHQYAGRANPRAQAKYLSVPLIKAKHRVARTIAAEVKGVLGA